MTIVKGALEFTITERNHARVVSEMTVTQDIINPYGVIHTGAMVWMADVTATLLVAGGDEGREGMKGFPLAINLSANLVGNQKGGKLKAVASFVKQGKTLSVVRTAVTGTADKLLVDVTTSHVLSR